MPAEKIPGWIKQVLMPELNEIKGELKAINTRINSLESTMDIKITALDGKIDSLRNETKAEIEGLRKEMLSKFEKVDIKIDSLRTEMNVRLDSIEKRIPVIEKITALEIKIADIEKRLALA